MLFVYKSGMTTDLCIQISDADADKAVQLELNLVAKLFKKLVTSGLKYYLYLN